MQQRESDTIDTRGGARQLMDRVREHIERNELEAALAVFAGLHPSDQADTLADLDAGPRETLLRALEPEESARILEKMEVEDAAEVFGEMEAPALSDILDETPARRGSGPAKTASGGAFARDLGGNGGE